MDGTQVLFRQTSYNGQIMLLSVHVLDTVNLLIKDR
jgi:hypothetical protein